MAQNIIIIIIIIIFVYYSCNAPPLPPFRGATRHISPWGLAFAQSKSWSSVRRHSSSNFFRKSLMSFAVRLRGSIRRIFVVSCLSAALIPRILFSLCRVSNDGIAYRDAMSSARRRLDRFPAVATRFSNVDGAISMHRLDHAASNDAFAIGSVVVGIDLIISDRPRRQTGAKNASASFSWGDTPHLTMGLSFRSVDVVPGISIVLLRNSRFPMAES